MIPMRACDVLCNLKNWTSWDYKAYKMQENEADPVVKALEDYIWHPVATEGLPKKDGLYLLTLHGAGRVDVLNIYHFGDDEPHYCTIGDINFLDIEAWRPISKLYSEEE